ncbi:MAG: hypothetical protein U0L61_03860 [Alistipes sp.]|nr:hypothetical protein [Alistipes sp.]
MKRLILLAILMLTTLFGCMAQQVDSLAEQQVIYIGSGGDTSVSSNNGRLTIMLNGSRFEIGSIAVDHGEDAAKVIPDDSDMVVVRQRPKAYFGVFGIGSPKINHFAFIEFGANTLVDADFSMYSPEDANAMMFLNQKSLSTTYNMGVINVPLNSRQTFVVSMAIGMTEEIFTFAGDYTLEYRDGMMYPLALDAKIEKSKLFATYIHLPIVLDWNISSDFFISAGVNLDLFGGSRLMYRKPRTTIERTVTLNPIQVGLTARVGWKRLYAFANYSFMDMFKEGTGPRGRRLSAGVGIWF